MAHDASWLKEHIRDVPDFPEPGIVYRDITPLLGHADACRFAVDAIADHFAGVTVDRVVAVEARGFLFGVPVAYRLGVGFAPARKPGKLPYEVERQEYELEYGSDAVEMHRDAVSPGERVLVVDDLLATGGTAAAAVALVERLGGEVVGLGFVVELTALGGRRQLGDRELCALVTYD